MTRQSMITGFYVPIGKIINKILDVKYGLHVVTLIFLSTYILSYFAHLTPGLNLDDKSHHYLSSKFQDTNYKKSMTYFKKKVKEDCLADTECNWVSIYRQRTMLAYPINSSMIDILDSYYSDLPQVKRASLSVNISHMSGQFIAISTFLFLLLSLRFRDDHFSIGVLILSVFISSPYLFDISFPFARSSYYGQHGFLNYAPRYASNFVSAGAAVFAFRNQIKMFLIMALIAFCLHVQSFMFTIPVFCLWGIVRFIDGPFAKSLHPILKNIFSFNTVIVLLVVVTAISEIVLLNRGVPANVNEYRSAGIVCLVALIIAGHIGLKKGKWNLYFLALLTLFFESILLAQNILLMFFSEMAGKGAESSFYFIFSRVAIELYNRTEPFHAVVTVAMVLILMEINYPKRTRAAVGLLTLILTFMCIPLIERNYPTAVNNIGLMSTDFELGQDRLKDFYLHIANEIENETYR